MDELGGNVDQVVPELRSLETVCGRHRDDGTSPRDVRAESLSRRWPSETTGDPPDTPASSSRPRNTSIATMWIRSCRSATWPRRSTSARVISARVFSQETGQTFKEYLTELRIKRAKELLRTTTLKAFEIGYQVGYNDPHYFSHVFHKNTGLTPMEFRLQAQAGVRDLGTVRKVRDAAGNLRRYPGHSPGSAAGLAAPRTPRVVLGPVADLAARTESVGAHQDPALARHRDPDHEHHQRLAGGAGVELQPPVRCHHHQHHHRQQHQRHTSRPISTRKCGGSSPARSSSTRASSTTSSTRSTPSCSR